MALATPGVPRLAWKGTPGLSFNGVIFFLRAHPMVQKECFSFLAYICNTTIVLPSPLDVF